jgi:tetratricopeptide (TPR) repeat protein
MRSPLDLPELGTDCMFCNVNQSLLRSLVEDTLLNVSAPRIHCLIGVKDKSILSSVGSGLKLSGALRVLWKLFFVCSFLPVLLYLLQPHALLIAEEQGDLKKLASLNRQATEFYQAGKLDAAIRSAQESLDISEKAFGSNHPATAKALDKLAELYFCAGDYAQAQSLLQRELKIAEKALGPDHPDTAKILTNLALLYRSTGDYTQAEALFQRAFKIDASVGEERGVGEQEALPQFPWPPPKASAEDTIPRELLVGNVEHPLLATVAQAMESAFRQAGYGKKSYYSVPSGFAMASQIEQINEDGSPKESTDRWSLEMVPIRHFSLGSYLNALFRAQPGYYRVIVFVITSKAFSQRGNVTPEESKVWVWSGLNKLPEEIGNQAYSPAYTCTALIYEFKRTGKHADLMEQSGITGEIHLQKAGLLTAFAKRP